LEPLFSPDAERIPNELEKDPENDRLVDAIWDVIDLITAEPMPALARRRALRSARGHSIWLVPIPVRKNDNLWVILWQPRGEDALIAYIGPEDFRL
jgi:hypothetical protein